jgi:Helix-turn-helix domain
MQVEFSPSPEFIQAIRVAVREELKAAKQTEESEQELSLTELAEKTGKHRNTIKYWHRNGKLKGVKRGNMWYFKNGQI